MDNINALFTAVETGDLDTIENILSENSELIEAVNSENITPLAAALYNSQADALQLLINLGAKINVPGKNRQTTIEWAREQDESSETAATLLLTDYMDRLYNTTMWWVKREADIKKIKLKEGELLPDASCDACGCLINNNDSTLLTIDEALSADKYTERLVNQAVKINNSSESEESRKKIKELIIKQIRDNNISSTYTVCDSCKDNLFSELIFGKNRKFILESIDKLFKDQL